MSQKLTMSDYKNRLKEESRFRLADAFGVAAEDAQRFGKWHNGLGKVSGFFTFCVGTGVLAGTGGAIVPALATMAATSVAGRLAINKLLPRAFSRAQPAPSTPEA